MDRFEHGGRAFAHPGVLDFSASLNPLGMPERARELLRAQVDMFSAYPDPDCVELTAAIARWERVPEAWVLACAGASDAFARLCWALRPSRALVCAPCYSGYEQALEQAGAGVSYCDLSDEDDFAVSAACAGMVEPGVDLVFLANPNNPTGRCPGREALVAFLRKARACGALVVLDECFIDLTEHAGSTDLLADYPNLVIVKAFTKSYALAGLRLGYVLCADEQLIMRLRRAGQPWAVSVPAQLAGVACLEERDYLPRAQRLSCVERTRVCAALAGMGLRVIESQANYLLFQGPHGLCERLLARGVLIRDCQNFRGLGPGWYRVAVRLPDENNLLIAALREVLS